MSLIEKLHKDSIIEVGSSSIIAEMGLPPRVGPVPSPLQCLPREGPGVLGTAKKGEEQGGPARLSG